jgi:hypothetical protein
MSCNCSASALRMFVRTVAQVNIPPYSPSLYSFHRVPQAASRYFSNSYALPYQRRYNLSVGAAIRQEGDIEAVARSASELSLSDDGIATSNQEAQLSKEPKPQSDLEASPSTLDSTNAVSPKHQTDQAANISIDYDNSFAELSSEAIEALAAEVAAAPRAEFEEDDAPFEASPPLPRAKQSSLSNKPTSQRAIQRLESESPNFTISYSSPLDRAWSSWERRSEDDAPADNWVPPKKEPWQIQKAKLKEKFPEGWNPQKRLSPDAIAGIRTLHAEMPEQYNTAVLAKHFKMSPDAIRRILKSKWRPDAETQTDREMRWFRRGERVWSKYAELGVKPPRRWRDEGIGRGKPEWKKRLASSHGGSDTKPALITTSRREGGFFGDDSSPPSITTRRSEDEMPELITTKRGDS